MPERLTTAELLKGPARYDAVSGLYRNTPQEDFFWFAFRRPESWVQLDAETRLHGDLHVEVDGTRFGFLIVDGAVALRCREGGPGYRRLHAMVQHGMTWPGVPISTETVTREGRQTLRCLWENEIEGEAVFDLTSGLIVRTEWPGEVVELTDLRFDHQVDSGVFDPPRRTVTGFRGGSAYILRSEETGSCALSWRPTSGPGSLTVPGPRNVTYDEAIEWARLRSDDVHISIEGQRS